jgi:hypothetical protein
LAGRSSETISWQIDSRHNILKLRNFHLTQVCKQVLDQSSIGREVLGQDTPGTIGLDEGEVIIGAHVDSCDRASVGNGEQVSIAESVCGGGAPNFGEIFGDGDDGVVAKASCVGLVGVIGRDLSKLQSSDGIGSLGEGEN